MYKKIINSLSSLYITLFSLFGLFILTFIATLAQVDMGIFEAKKYFFEGVFVYLPVGNFNIPIFFSGYTLGVIMLINLCCAHFKRFVFKWSKIGIWLTHIGLIILIIGSGIISSYTIESQLSLEEGQSKNYTQSVILNELVVLESIDDENDRVFSFPESFLAEYSALVDPDLPFSIEPISYFENSTIGRVPEGIQSIASQGLGSEMIVTPRPKSFNDKERNMPSAHLEVFYNNQSLGVWTVSALLAVEQSLGQINGKNYRIALRPKRYYLDFNIKLNEFSHDKYIGTETPKNFSSLVELTDKTGSFLESFLIYMNHPLRYDGKTFYQASFGKEDTLSVFQVVENPGWLLPYISSIIMSLGLLIHFIILLVTRLNKTSNKRTNNDA